MFLVPYLLTIVALELAAIIYLSLYTESKEIPKKKRNDKQETFNGFYVDR